MSSDDNIYSLVNIDARKGNSNTRRNVLTSAIKVDTSFSYPINVRRLELGSNKLLE